MRYAVIMAGGSGKRLWPMSREQHPKQVLPFIGGKSLIEIARERLAGVFEPDHILVVTSATYLDEIAALLPDIPKENLLAEPQGRDTANAVALAAAVIEGRQPGASMAILTADQVIRPQEQFTKVMDAALTLAESWPDSLGTFGVKPTTPHTGLGYIQTGERCEYPPQTAYNVTQFKEKPDRHLAMRYVSSGNYFWNSGMFVWTVEAIQKALHTHLPDSAHKLIAVTEAVRAGEPIQPLIDSIYPTLEKISIDFAVMEKADSVFMVELGCEWIDVGSWPALEEVCDPDSHNNVVQAAEHIMIDSYDNIIVSEDPEHLIATIGLDKCIVVHTKDATLVCKKSDGQRIKDLVEAIQRERKERYL